MIGAFILDDFQYVFHHAPEAGLVLIGRTGPFRDREPMVGDKKLTSAGIVRRLLHIHPVQPPRASKERRGSLDGNVGRGPRYHYSGVFLPVLDGTEPKPA